MIINYEQLIEQAFEARKYAYCKYSKFAVGAALLTKTGVVYTGCNVENGSYGATNCAERTAIFKAVSEGEKDFRAIAIVGGAVEKGAGELQFCYPCGICRQVMQEFSDAEFEIIVATDTNNYKVYTLSELLPFSFEL